jgi:L-asparaginase
MPVNCGENLRFALVTTGGTIASRIDPATGLALPVLTGDDLLKAVPGGTELLAGVEVHDFCRVGSPHMTPGLWAGLQAFVQSLLDRGDIGGVVIAHGTATLEETAWFLDLTVRGDKPVVLTGAQRNASSADFDGPRNLLAAFAVCRHPDARGKGVLVVFNDRINAARDVTKTHTVDVETFQSGEWGYLGSVFDGRVRFHRAPTRRLHLPLGTDELPSVEIVSVYPGATGVLVRAAAAAGAKGLVLQAISAGHVTEPVYHAVLEVLGQGLPVVVASRIPRGGTRAGYGFPGSSQNLVDAGAVLSGDLSAWKARVLLMLALQQGPVPRARLMTLFD